MPDRSQIGNEIHFERFIDIDMRCHSVSSHLADTAVPVIDSAVAFILAPQPIQVTTYLSSNRIPSLISWPRRSANIEPLKMFRSKESWPTLPQLRTSSSLKRTVPT